MIAAYGDRAKHWAAGAKVDGDVIAADETAYLRAIVEAVRRRMRGEPFGLALFLDEDPNRFARVWSAKMIAAAKTFDERRAACGAIGMGNVIVDGKRQAELSGVTADTLSLGRLLWHLAERGVVVAESSYTRLATIFARWHPTRVIPEQDDPEVPRPIGSRTEPEQVVIWAGTRSADEIAIILCALEELHVPVYVVCRGGSVPETIHRCTPAQAEPLLRSAAAIVDATDDHPGTALALARFGAPLAVARTSGAQELIEGVAGFDGWNRDSILAAALQALGASAPSVVAPSRALRGLPTAVRERAPLVSVVIPTRNRREYLPHALESVARQDYPAVETIVVNDSEPVRDITERFGAVLLEYGESIDHATAWNEGIKRARGEFVAFLDDDDLFFPDHLSSLVDTALTGRAAAVHSSSIIAHRGEAPDEFIGFSPGGLTGVELEETLVYCPLIGMISSLVRRDVFEEIGYFDAAITPNDDYEMIVRIALRYDWLHADRVTYLYAREGAYSHYSVRGGVRYAELYEESYKRHPFPDRPLLAARRRQFIERIRAQNGIVLNAVSARLAGPIKLGYAGARDKAHSGRRGRRAPQRKR